MKVDDLFTFRDGSIAVCGLTPWDDNVFHTVGDIVSCGTKQWKITAVDKIHQGSFGVPTMRHHAFKLEPIGHTDWPNKGDILLNYEPVVQAERLGFAGKILVKIQLDSPEIHNNTTKEFPMKVSELMEEIIEVATEKFGVSGHINDGITINVGYQADNADINENWVWGASLSRPTQNQLDRGETECEYVHTIKLNESRIGFFACSSTLVEALRDLLEQVDNADEYDFQI